MDIEGVRLGLRCGEDESDPPRPPSNAARQLICFGKGVAGYREYEYQKLRSHAGFFSSSACAYNVEKQQSPDVLPLKEPDAYPAMLEECYGQEKHESTTRWSQLTSKNAAPRLCDVAQCVGVKPSLRGFTN